MAIFSVGDLYWVGAHPSLYHQIAVNRTCQDCINSYTVTLVIGWCCTRDWISSVGICWREFGIIEFDLGELEYSQQDLWEHLVYYTRVPMIKWSHVNHWVTFKQIKQHSGHNSPGPIFVLIGPMKQWPNFGQSSSKRWHSKFNHISLNGFNFNFKWKFTLVSKICCFFSICPILTYCWWKKSCTAWDV